MNELTIYINLKLKKYLHMLICDKK